MPKRVNTQDASSLPEPPIPNSYWVEPRRLLAGEYPGPTARAAGSERLQRLLAAGVTFFLDLTEPGELTPYEPLIPTAMRPGGRKVIYTRNPIHDHSVPEAPETMARILEQLDRALAGGHCVYLHCQAGIGRTGTVLGCYFVHHGMTPAAALRHLNNLWRANQRSKLWPRTPETDEQLDFVRHWRAAPATPLASREPAGAVSLRDRYRGALLGLAAGDALGASVQHCTPGSFTPVTDMIGGGPFHLPPGAWTDDTAMALCLAESLTEWRGFDAADQIARYQRWQREGHLTSTGDCVGITAGVTKALAMAHWSGKAFAGSHDPAQLHKETLSRVAPAVLYFRADPQEAIHHAAEAARTTHQAPLVLDSCRYLAALLVGALQGVGREQLLGARYAPISGLWAQRPLKKPVEAVARGSYRARSAGEINSGGSAVQALEAALWALDHSDSFREGVLLAVNLGRDADVIGAIYGQLAGALYGCGGIPVKWRNALAKRDLIEGFADRLLAASQEKEAVSG